MIRRWAAALALGALSGCAPRASQPPVSHPAPEPEPGPERVAAVLEGQASYYSDKLAGRSTASGEPYDPSALTAAHRSLPFGTRLRVTRADNGRSVVVRVNDRGPFGSASRIVDLSRAAAEQLDMIRAGVVAVRAEVLGSHQR
jgi:rare lipoprotein A